MSDRIVTFDDRGLVPTVVQHGTTGEVLMVAWMDSEALRMTRETGEAHFWSRSRRARWKKGETSGNTLAVQALSVDCDGDTVLLQVVPVGPACHTGARTCFSPERHRPEGFADLEVLWATIAQRLGRANGRETPSYTRTLAEGGVEATGAKVLEEAAEAVEAAGLHQRGTADDRRVAEEAADLVYHLLVLLAERQISPALIMEVLRSRRRAPAPG